MLFAFGVINHFRNKGNCSITLEPIAVSMEKLCILNTCSTTLIIRDNVVNLAIIYGKNGVIAQFAFTAGIKKLFLN